MKALPTFLALLACASGYAATSEILFPRGGSTFSGAAGNVVFNGQQFVAATVRSNGALELTLLDTNGVTVSNLPLPVVCSSPRVAVTGDDYLVAWLNTNVAPFELNCARVSGGVIGAVSTIATNVANETISIGGRSEPFLAVWQSADPHGVVSVRALHADGTPIAAAAIVSSSPQSQRYPSVDTDGTGFLVCWMEQNGGGLECDGSNYWRVVAEHVVGGVPTGIPFTVSQTNSARAFATACSFGTNFLVLWSSDHKSVPDPNFPCSNPSFEPAIHGRMVSVWSVGNEFVVVANPFNSTVDGRANTNAAVAFGGGRYLVGNPNYTGQQRVQPVAANGSLPEFAISGPELTAIESARIAYGGDAFCVIYGGTSTTGLSLAFAPAWMPYPLVPDVRRAAGGSISITSSMWSVEVSTNFVEWKEVYGNGIPYAYWPNTNPPHLFIRGVEHKWKCIEQLRAIDWAQQRWAFDSKKSNSDWPPFSELFGTNRYLKTFVPCPASGSYFLNRVDVKPTCSLSVFGHTL